MTNGTGQHQPWEMILVAGKGPGSLVWIAREGLLARHVQGAYIPVGLSLVDESVLALVDLAIGRRSNVTIVYPSPAGDVVGVARSSVTDHGSSRPP